jgi:preprotein translocase subunit YajC
MKSKKNINSIMIILIIVIIIVIIYFLTKKEKFCQEAGPPRCSLVNGRRVCVTDPPLCYDY